MTTTRKHRAKAPRGFATLPLDASIADLRALVGNQPGRYRLDPPTDGLSETTEVIR